MVAIRPIESIDNFFLFAALKSAQVRAQVENIQVGTTIPHFKKSDFDKLLIPVPPLPAQKAIGLLHYRLGLKVETNRRISENLESIAQTLFRSWFVDFDPVRAKMAGEKPAGMDDATAELFPDSMEESELGEIPAGWKVGDLGELCHLTMGQSPPGDAYNLSGEGLPFYQGRTDFGMRFPKTRMYSTLGNRKASPGDVLVSVRAPVGDLNQALEECVIGRGVAAVIHRSGSQAYSYSLMQSIQHRLEYFNGEGTVFGAINKTDFSSIPLVEPPVELLNRFDELASPVNGLLRSLHEQSQNLAATRDALLPRLISGELEVPEDLLVS
jgi:type I restriction enzyme S subunit